MAQLELTGQTVRLAHIAFPSKGKENNDKTIPVALKFKFEVQNDWLAHFHPRLSSALYMIDDSADVLEGVEQARTKRVFGDMLEKVSLGTELNGASGHIKHGVNSSISIETALVKGFKVIIKEGGTVQVEFLVIARFPSKDIKTLAELKEGDVEISLGMTQGEIPLGND